MFGTGRYLLSVLAEFRSRLQTGTLDPNQNRLIPGVRYSGSSSTTYSK